MPTYEYLCRQCGHRFEIWQHMTDDPLTVCPKCGEAAIHRVLYPAGIVFKGSGFYRTEYGGSNGGGASKEAPESKTVAGESKKSTPEASKSASENSKSEGVSTPSSSTATAAD
jgi:putative FmdB family regulatory protein